MIQQWFFLPKAYSYRMHSSLRACEHLSLHCTHFHWNPFSPWFIFSHRLWSLTLLSVKIQNKRRKRKLFSLAAFGDFKIKNPPYFLLYKLEAALSLASFQMAWIVSLPLFDLSLRWPRRRASSPPCPLSPIFHSRCLSRQQKIKLSALPCTKALYGISSPVCHSSLNSYPLHSHPDLCKWTFA